jgi:hypothetical protein
VQRRQREPDVVAFRNDDTRGKAAGSLTALAGLILIVALAQRAPAIAIAVFVGVTLFVAYRNWTAGLFVARDAVVVRNIVTTRRLPLSRVRSIEFRRGKQLTRGWGDVFVVDESGHSRRVTALRRSPKDGEILAREVTAAVARRRRAAEN